MNIYLIGALLALIVGIGLFAISSKERGENGEWSDGLQWGYLLTMIGIFGLLAFKMSFTAVLLVFVVFTGAIWLWRKLSFKPGQTTTVDEKGQKVLSGTLDDENHFRDYMSGFFPIILTVFILRTFIAEPFQIPSSSMRPGLVKGDFILVNKFAYGIRMPIMNNVLIDTGTIQRGDVVVFNYPLAPETNYIKRAIGIPGDVVEYKDKVLTVNGQPVPQTAAGNYEYPEDENPALTHSSERFQTALNGKNFDILLDEGQPSFNPEGLLRYLNVLMPEKNYQGSGLKEFCQYAEDGSAFTCKVPEGRYFMMGDNRDNSADSRYWGFVDDKLIVGKAFFIWMNLGDFGRIGNSVN